jgi:hypothetical protein
MRKIVEKLDDPEFAQTFHGWATVVWLVISLPCSVLLKDSLAFVVWISLYAVVVAHWSSWQASRTEVMQQKMEEEQNNGE